MRAYQEIYVHDTYRVFLFIYARKKLCAGFTGFIGSLNVITYFLWVDGNSRRGIALAFYRLPHFY